MCATVQKASPESLRAWVWDLVLSLLQLTEGLRAISDDWRIKSLVSQVEAKLSAKSRWCEILYEYSYVHFSGERFIHQISKGTCDSK